MTSEADLSAGELRKWHFLQDAPRQDAQHPRIQEIAAHLWEAALHRPRWFVVLAHTYARDCIRYVTDTNRTGTEDIAGYTRNPMPDDAVDAIVRGADDCDAKARVFCALCLAVGIPAEMIGFEREGQLPHVAARVYLDGQWFAVETTLARARLGDTAETIPKEKDGRWANN